MPLDPEIWIEISTRMKRTEAREFLEWCRKRQISMAEGVRQAIRQFSRPSQHQESSTTNPNSSKSSKLNNTDVLDLVLLEALSLNNPRLMAILGPLLKRVRTRMSTS